MKYLLLGCIALVGCVRTQASMLNPTQEHSPICPNGVVIYTDTSRVPKPYEEVALLNATGSSGWTTEAGMLNSMRQRAARAGANGVVMPAMQDASAGAKVAGAIFGVGTQRKGQAVAIHVPGDSLRVQNACDGIKNKRNVATQ